MATIVEMINPLTGLPEQVDKLDHTAQEIDDAVDLAPQLSNPNLLDNWHFGNPVNQRGQTSYADAGYGIDRWKLVSGGSGTCWMLIEDDWITIGTDTKFGVYFSQIVEPSVVKALAGKTVTLSVLAGENSGAFSGNIYINGSWNDYWAIKANDVSTKKYTVPANATSMFIQYAESGSGAGTCKFKAVKLELGSQQTLAHQENGVWVLNEIPDYGERLARCQRYFQLYSSADLRPAKAVDCRPTMRADPSQSTIVVNSTTYYYNTADL